MPPSPFRTRLDGHLRWAPGLHQRPPDGGAPRPPPQAARRQLHLQPKRLCGPRCCGLAPLQPRTAGGKACRQSGRRSPQTAARLPAPLPSSPGAFPTAAGCGASLPRHPTAAAEAPSPSTSPFQGHRSACPAPPASPSARGTFLECHLPFCHPLTQRHEPLLQRSVSFLFELLLPLDITYDVQTLTPYSSSSFPNAWDCLLAHR